MLLRLELRIGVGDGEVGGGWDGVVMFDVGSFEALARSALRHPKFRGLGELSQCLLPTSSRLGRLLNKNHADSTPLR